MVIQSFLNRFQVMQRNGVKIEHALDIGAYRGDFTSTLKAVWPRVRVKQFEADDRNMKWLDSTASLILLGDSRRVVDFYTLDGTKNTTGSSIFRENTVHYQEGVTVNTLQMYPLDLFLDEAWVTGNWAEHGLVKLDTQGSELLILKGGINFLADTQPRFILIECSIQQYNEGAPLVGEVIAQMLGYGYSVKDVMDLNYDSRGQLLQTDLLFERNQL